MRVRAVSHEARGRFDSVSESTYPEPVHAPEALNFDARKGDFLSEDFGGRRFDVICMWDTIEHLAKPDEFLARAASLLIPNGLLYLTTGDIGSWNARWRKEAWRQIHPPCTSTTSRAELSPRCWIALASTL